ncbi:MAG: type II/IV secretion system ATPase subunit [Candidatus Diapherotrites archaeon]
MKTIDGKKIIATKGNAEKENLLGHPDKWSFDPEKLKRAEPDSVKTKGKPSPIVETKIEKMMNLLQSRKTVDFAELSRELGISQESVENIGKVMEKHGLVDVKYPATMIHGPKIEFKKGLTVKERKEDSGAIIERYSLNVDFVPAEVRIVQSKEEGRAFYDISLSILGPYTELFFEELKEDIAEKIPFEIVEITDYVKNQDLKKKFFEISKAELGKYIAGDSERNINLLAGTLLHSMYGLGNLELLMSDNFLEEVAINSSKTPVAVYHRTHGWLKTNVFLGSEDAISNYSSQIGRKVGREINTLNPILDAHLLSGDRVNATLAPISSSGNTLTIRRFSRRPWTIIDFIGKSHAMSIEMAALLWMAMQYEMSIVVAGGTASGKTSALNVLSSFIPNYHRIISIEDVREIMLPETLKWNWVPLSTRTPNPEGMGEVSMLDLMQASLRMRPDRIILGEIRRRKEAEVLFEAMHTGHSVYSTIHANSGQQVLRRLTEPPIEIPPLEVEALDLLIVQYRDRRSNVRRTYEISEIDSGVSEQQMSINNIYRWRPREDSWDKVNEPTKLIQTLNLHTGMTTQEISRDVLKRAEILSWMVENKVDSIDLVGQMMKLYYSDEDSVVHAVEKNYQAKRILEM